MKLLRSPFKLAMIFAITVLLTPHVHAAPSLENAVDLDEQSLNLASSPGASWTCSAFGSYDGTDVAVSASISHDEATGFELELTGPDTVSFWWKTSSEEDFDLLTVSLNGTVTDALSGETGWEAQSIQLPPGDHVLRWAYTKDSDFSEGLDRAWVDEIRVASRSLPVVDYPSMVGAHLGQPIEIIPETNDAITSYTLNGSTPAWVTFDAATGRISGQPTTIGDVSLSITAQNANGSTTPQSIMIRTTDLGNGLEALASGWHWQGAHPWATQDTHSHDGIDALRAGTIGHGESSELRLPIEGPAVIRFWWRVDSEESHDLLGFFVDDDVVRETSGLNDWERQSVVIPAGPHTISWKYQKDLVGVEGEDTAWLDEVEIIDGRDPDDDGFSTLVEVCLGTDWKRPNIDPMELPTESGGLLDWQITKGSDLDGLKPVLEISYDLKNWSPLPIISESDLVIQGREALSSNKPCKFVRVRAEIVP